MTHHVSHADSHTTTESLSADAETDTLAVATTDTVAATTTETVVATPQNKSGRLDPKLRAEIRDLFFEFSSEPADSTRRVALRAELVELNTPLVKYLVRRFRNTAEPMDDITQVGMVGLIKAIDRFEPDRGLEFSTYAVPTILGEIRRYFRDSTWPVHVPRGTRELSSAITATVPDLSQQLGRAPTVTELAQSLDVSEDAILQAMDAGNCYLNKSLDSMAEQLAGETREFFAATEDSDLEQVEQRADLRPALATLPERQREALVLRFVYDKSQSQIAAVLGVSQMQVSRLLSRSMTQLRELLEDPRRPEVPAA
jgi:RNA polymerase sigma-B factor